MVLFLFVYAMILCLCYIRVDYTFQGSHNNRMGRRIQVVQREILYVLRFTFPLEHYRDVNIYCKLGTREYIYIYIYIVSGADIGRLS